MVDDLLAENFSVTKTTLDNTSSSPILEIIEKKSEAEAAWRQLSDQVRQNNYKGDIKKFFKERLPDISTEQFERVKSYNQVINEVSGRKNSDYLDRYISLPVGLSSFKTELIELLEDTENKDRIIELYKVRKCTVANTKNAGVKVEEALKIKSCLRQGRELFQAALSGGLVTKPLNYFYSLTAYAYAITLLNNPTKYAMSSLPSSHGVKFTRSDLMVEFGADTPVGTLSELIKSFPTINLLSNSLSVVQDNYNTTSEFGLYNVKVSAGSLLSMIPEISSYYTSTTGRPSRAFKLEVNRSNNQFAYDFYIGDGITLPSYEEVYKSFPGLSIANFHGKYRIIVPQTEVQNIKASIWMDFNGNLWFIENPFFPLILPDIAIHFMICCILSNIMRYDPHYWGGIINSDLDTKTTLLIKRYISSLEYIFPILILKNTSNYFPYIQSY